jgi:hypothetical protein
LKKIVPLLLLFVLIPFVYHGAGYLFNPTITKVGVSLSTGFGKVNPDFFAVFEDRPTLNLFKLAVSKAVKLPGIVDVAQPDYDVEMVYANGHKEGLHMWLYPEGPAGAIMYLTNTHIICTLPEDIAGRLAGLLAPFAAGESEPVGRSKPADDSSEDDDAAGSTAGVSSPSDFSIKVNDSIIALHAWDYEVNLEDVLGPSAAQSVEVLEHADTLTGSFVKRLDYDGLQLELFSPKQNGETFWIMSIMVSGKGYLTPRGIGVGSTLEELKSAYPAIETAPDGRTDPRNAAYRITDEGCNHLQFEVQDGVVDEIRIYHLIP